MLRLRFPEAVDAAGFLRRFWQREPLLIPGALKDFRCPLTAEELAGLACEPEVESRLVLQTDDDAWQLRHGPFTPESFARLPERRWTLLVQDVDKHVPAVARLLEAFDFLPDWRIDDVMVSYAADGGSVGPHTDAYDVFLLQAEGRRHWRIDSRPAPDAPLRADTDLKLLAQFAARHEWLLEPGDMLYLPPGVAHWGVAAGPCVTCSVGFRAPAWRELLTDWCEHLIARTPDDRHYRDPPLAVPALSAEIPSAVFDAVDGLLERLQYSTAAERRRWFGRLVTEPKPDLTPEPAAAALTPAGLHAALRSRGAIRRHPWTRTAVATVAPGQVLLFANGLEFEVPATCRDLLRRLSHARALRFGYLEEWLDRPPCLELLARLYNAGVLILPDD